MVFAYYQGLSKAQKVIYRKSNAISHIVLPYPQAFKSKTVALQHALDQAEKVAVLGACREIVSLLALQLKISRPRIKILLNRPHDQYGELQGLYESAYDAHSPLITLWMKTAKRHQVVAFRTFLRTLLHEVCHHLDYEYFKLEDSFHTEGFYQREASLFKQMI